MQFTDLVDTFIQGETLEEPVYNASWPAVQRLENPHHWPNLKQLDKAARALGKRLILTLE